MSAYLPECARAYIDETDLLGSVQRLTSAVETGAIDLAVLKTFVGAMAAGRPLQFQKTKPVSMLMLEEIRRFPNEEPRRIVYRGLQQGLWTYEDVEHWEANNEVLASARKTSVTRGVYLTRNRRVRSRLANVSDQFVPKLSLDVICKHDLQDGAKACLATLLSLAGKEDEVVTYTSSIAQLLGRTARTVRNYFIALEHCGLIERRPGRSANTVHIRISKAVRPEAYNEPKDITAYKLARRSSNPALREMAETVAAFAWSVHGDVVRQEEGRKQISSFNLILNPNSDEPPTKRLERGATTHSTFMPKMGVDRNLWNRQNATSLWTGVRRQ